MQWRRISKVFEICILPLYTKELVVLNKYNTICTIIYEMNKHFTFSKVFYSSSLLFIECKSISRVFQCVYCSILLILVQLPQQIFKG
jgi:hypothetical protein